jgi:transcriptional repressor NrdR
MKCYFCGALDSKVIDSRPTEEGLSIRRRRECTSCGRRFTTYEKIEMLPLVVVKRDNSREPFNPEKIKRAVLVAAGKRPIPMSEIDRLVEEIEVSLQNTLEQEISSAKIGEYVMAKLRDLDEVAYIRFASVYRQFKDINTFKQQLDQFIDEGEAEKKDRKDPS